MNCKPGDLAVVVRSANGNEGKLVTCIRLATSHDLAIADVFRVDPVWVIDRQLLATNEYRQKRCHVHLCPDENLRPIRPQPDDAEDLRFADLPTKQGAPA